MKFLCLVWVDESVFDRATEAEKIQLDIERAQCARKWLLLSHRNWLLAWHEDSTVEIFHDRDRVPNLVPR